MIILRRRFFKMELLDVVIRVSIDYTEFDFLPFGLVVVYDTLRSYQARRRLRQRIVINQLRFNCFGARYSIQRIIHSVILRQPKSVMLPLHHALVGRFVN